MLGLLKLFALPDNVLLVLSSEDFSPEKQLLFGVGYCLFMLALFWVAKTYPPKKINDFYGYRTQRSMANQDVWDAANSFSMKIMMKVSLWSFGFPVVFYFVLPEYNFLGVCIGNTALILSSIFFTERYLNQHFDKKGNRK